ncbi:MAG: carboxypeptidase regulatory-like domain-containing protein [Acidobacteriota bacterium]|nr:carboxypeptidase regulatory-like domain-containing protein [Acidobacteriota bacterium]
MKRIVIAMAVGLALLSGATAFAQGSNGSIQVIAEAQDGSRLPGVTVMAESTEVLGTRNSVTNADGVATLTGLAPSARYVVISSLEGFNGARNENVLVKAGQTTTLRITLSLSSVTEELVVTSESPIVDVTSAVTGQDITLELTESLPTGRSYQSYLQLVPGVMPTDPTVREQNPASRSGLNYRDIGGENGVSRDNFYYLEGINVTDPVQGTYGADLNTEIIQEQSVITGGIPAEFVGSAGLISSVVTKSGGNAFSGSVNYYFQNDSLVASNKNAPDAKFDTFDTAITLGGPIVQDKAWFFGSFRQTELNEDVISLDTDEFLRTVTETSDQGFFKLSWAPTGADRITGTYLSDPTDRSGSLLRDVLNNRDSTRETGGDRFTVNYSHVFGSQAFLDVSGGKHNGESSTFAADPSTRNNVIFLESDQGTFSLQDEQKGGSGANLVDERDNEFLKGTYEFFAGTSWGDHTLKFGAERSENISFRDSTTTGNPPAVFTSPDIRYLGDNLTANDIANLTWTDTTFNHTNASDFGGLINTINADPRKDEIYAAMDTNHDGVLSEEEVGAGLQFNSTAGNPTGDINYERIIQTAAGPQTLGSEGAIYYIQDTWQNGQWSVNAGVRAEEWRHKATTGQEIFKFDLEYAPRISVVYDLKGDGRQKLSAYYGRYFDPVRNNMTQFAGTLTGRIRDEQVYVSAIDDWLTFRTRGGPVAQDAFFAPTTKTPYTDDLMVGYQRDLGQNMSFEASYISRQTRDILEDYDLALYADQVGGGTLYPGPLDHPDSLWLGLDYFGYTENPGSNFVIATLAGGERDWDGLELVFRKRYSDKWQALASALIADGTGNSNSDSNADFQGDVLFLDPRAPGQQGTQPGLIENLVKLAGSYHFDNGIVLGGQYRWNSGTIASRTFSASRRNLPIRVPTGEEFEFAGITSRWLAPDAVGSLTNPSWGTLDLRVQYNRSFGRFEGEFFLDSFNVFDEQGSIRDEDLVAGSGAAAFGEGIQFVPPQRYFLGVRFSI